MLIDIRESGSEQVTDRRLLAGSRYINVLKAELKYVEAAKSVTNKCTILSVLQVVVVKNLSWYKGDLVIIFK